jgi:OOP family OmpA-OmpF porin
MIFIMVLLSAKISFAETPWYVGAGFGMTNYQGDSVNDVPQANIDIDSWQTSYSLFGGYQFNERWAVEAGYVDFGETDDFDPNGQILGIGIDYETSGFYLNGQYHIPLNNSLSLDLVGGWLFGKADANEVFPPNTGGNPQSASFNDNGAMLGLAFTWQIARSFGLRGNANYYTVDYDNTIKAPWRLGADLIWNF